MHSECGGADNLAHMGNGRIDVEQTTSSAAQVFLPGASDFDLAKRFMERNSESADVVVFGSGMSGMMAAADLSKVGRKVLMLEQATVIGAASVDPRIFQHFPKY